ncbi:MAG: cytochrome b/b6 domain-containing protein [Anaerolineae bacterium]|mgnify:CR=1 FL=1|jgi:formate dehydrogenase subunit gamma|nr:cytochrome b/b6 domain-containing protein [Anaerolineae bacterium]MDX9832332.1 cytochrome b/b6 domain-containing protein [Anaerolineae bacterium]
MSVRLRGSDAAISIRWIPKYTTLERLLHWVHTATFIPLALTGFVLFAPFLGPVAAGEAGMHIRLIHRVAAIFFGGVPIVYAILQPRRMFMNLREFLSFSKYDLLWLKNAFPYYVLGRHGHMPPQPRFNTGERLTAVVMVLGTITFGITGLSMWFLKGIMPPILFQLMVLIHDLMFIVTFAMFMIHFYLAVIHPMMWQSLVSMRYGVVSESYAREHHAMWYYGEKRAKEMYEARKARGDH